MSIRPHPKRGAGWWIIDYYPAGRKGKRVRFPFQGKKGEALALEQELRRSPGEISTVVSPLVKDLIPAWLDYYQNEVAPSKYEDARVCLRHWLPHFGNFRPANVSRAAINKYKAVRLQEVTNAKAIDRGEEPKYTSKRTINKELSYLSSCLKWAAANGHCVDLTFQIKGFPAKQTRAKVPVVLTPRQISKELVSCQVCHLVL